MSEPNSIAGADATIGWRRWGPGRPGLARCKVARCAGESPRERPVPLHSGVVGPGLAGGLLVVGTN